jgi:hypothetical protein
MRTTRAMVCLNNHEEDHNICWNEIQGIRPRLTRSVNPDWTSLPSGLLLSQQKSENCNSVQCRLRGKTVFLCWYRTENLPL